MESVYQALPGNKTSTRLNSQDNECIKNARSMRSKEKENLHDTSMTESKVTTEKVFDLCIHKYKAKYSREKSLRFTDSLGVEYEADAAIGCWAPRKGEKAIFRGGL